MEAGTIQSRFSADTPVRYVMSRGVIALPEDTSVGACALAMKGRGTHAVLIVTYDRQPLGWIFQLDILKHIAGDPLTTLARDAVSEHAQTIEPEASVKEAAERMIETKVTHLLVARAPGMIPEGVLSTWDLVSHYAESVGHSM